MKNWLVSSKVQLLGMVDYNGEMTKSAFLVQFCVVVIVLLCFMWLLFHVHVDILLIKQEVLVALTIIGWCEISLESRRRRRRSRLSLKWVHQHKFSEWWADFKETLLILFSLAKKFVLVPAIWGTCCPQNCVSYFQAQNYELKSMVKYLLVVAPAEWWALSMKSVMAWAAKRPDLAYRTKWSTILSYCYC